MQEPRPLPKRKISWGEATRRFIYRKDEEARTLRKMAAATAAFLRVIGIGGTSLVYLDNVALIVPGVGLLSTLNDGVAVIVYSFCIIRIAIIRRDANRDEVQDE